MSAVRQPRVVGRAGDTFRPVIDRTYGQLAPRGQERNDFAAYYIHVNEKMIAMNDKRQSYSRKHAGQGSTSFLVNSVLYMVVSSNGADER